MLQKTCHFKSRLAFEMGYRQKCQIAHDFLPKFRGVRVSPIVSKNPPLRYLIAAKNCAYFGKYRALARRPEMLQKMGHLYARLAFKMGPRQKYQIAQDFTKKIV